MTVVAIKYRGAMPASAADATSQPSNDLRARESKPLVSAKTTARGNKASSDSTSTATSKPPRQVVTFKCRRLVRSSEDPSSEVEDGETYVSELPFAILPAQ